MSIERREYPRFRKTFSVIIHRPYEEGRIETSDVSMGGLSINNSQKYYDVEQSVYLELVLPDGESIFCNARVASVYPHSKDAETYKVDLQFLDMSDKDKKRLKACLDYPDE